MADLRKRAQASVSQELLCHACGEVFIFRKCEQEAFARRGWTKPKHCPVCRKKRRELQRKETQRQENEKRHRDKAAEKHLFEVRLKDWKVVAKDDIRPGNDDCLYIIGNGFDLMHGVKSSYYAFRDFLGKKSHLRYMLENYLTPEDIWVDFEDALAHFNIRGMCGKFLIDSWLDIFGAYDEDANASAFFLASEAAASPILTVANELPPRFRMWVETLSLGTADRPLRGMFRNGKVLCFNYTEFVETLYGVSRDSVCYIHGCRRKKKNHPKEPLILGHLPSTGDDAYDFPDNFSPRRRDSNKHHIVDTAREQVFRLVTQSDEMLTKYCGDIITAHEAFFAGLNKIRHVIVIGHSFAPVDRDYFLEIASRLSDIESTHWYFGCHGSHDLVRLEQLLTMLGISKSAVSVFRTDNIKVAPLGEENAPVPGRNGPFEKTRCISTDKRWAVKTVGSSMSIVNLQKQETDYKTMFSTCVGATVFVPSGEYLLAVTYGVDPGVFLFGIVDGHWEFVNELESIPNQSVLNRRLCHVFLTAGEITFVYNNRVRSYSLIDGRLISNRGLRNARNRTYDGEEITHLLKVRYGTGIPGTNTINR